MTNHALAVTFCDAKSSCKRRRKDVAERSFRAEWSTLRQTSPDSFPCCTCTDCLYNNRHGTGIDMLVNLNNSVFSPSIFFHRINAALNSCGKVPPPIFAGYKENDDSFCKLSSNTTPRPFVCKTLYLPRFLLFHLHLSISFLFYTGRFMQTPESLVQLFDSIFVRLTDPKATAAISALTSCCCSTATLPSCTTIFAHCGVVCGVWGVGVKCLR